MSAALNVDALGMNENIFDYGAHSLIVAQICAAVRNRLRALLEIKDVFHHPTAADIARLLSKRKVAAPEDEEVLAIPKAPRDKPIPLTYQQEQIWFLSKFAPNSRAYNSQLSVRLSGKLDKHILERCLNEIVRRHEILRTTFQEQDGLPVQVVHEPWEVSLLETDLSHLPHDRREEEVERCITSEMNICFDYAELPLVRWRLYRLGEEDWIFLFIEHHFLHDGWEVGVFLRELETLYAAFFQGRESPLEDLPIQYADYAVWQKMTLCGKRLEEKVQYWINKIRDYPHVLNFHIDHPRPDVQSFRGDAFRFNLDRDCYQSLRELSR